MKKLQNSTLGAALLIALAFLFIDIPFIPKAVSHIAILIIAIILLIK